MLTSFEIFLCAVLVAFLAILLLGFAMAKRQCKNGGLAHTWYSPAFRVRVCVHCGRREILMRSWEFDGYDAAIAKAQGGAA